MRKKNVKLWNHITKQLDDFNIQVGWFENSRYDDDTPIGGIAAVQNYGAHIKVTDKMRGYLGLLGLHLKKTTDEIIIPPSPFMDNAKARIQGEEGKKIILQELLRVFEGRQTIEQAANRLALWAQGIVQEEIKAITTPPLSQATIALRNSEYESKSKNISTKRLGGSGIMFGTVQHKVTLK